MQQLAASVAPSMSDNMELRHHDQLATEFMAVNSALDAHHHGRPSAPTSSSSQQPHDGGGGGGGGGGPMMMTTRVIGATSTISTTPAPPPAVGSTSNNVSDDVGVCGCCGGAGRNVAERTRRFVLSTLAVDHDDGRSPSTTTTSTRHVPPVVFVMGTVALVLLLIIVVVATVLLSSSSSSSSSTMPHSDRHPAAAAHQHRQKIRHHHNDAGAPQETKTTDNVDDGTNSKESDDSKQENAKNTHSSRKNYTVDDHANFKLKAEARFPHWISETAYVYTGQDGAVQAHDLSDDRRYPAVPADIMTKYNVECVQFSPDGQRALLLSDVSPIFKYSELAIVRVYNLQLKTVVRLKPPAGSLVAATSTSSGSVDGPTSSSSSVNDTRLYYAEWAPDSNSIVFLYRTQLWLQPLPIRADRPAVALRRYPDSLHRTVFLAMPDWAYEHHVWFSNRALAFNQDSTRLAFATVYDILVPTATIPTYSNTNNFYQYPKFTEIKYAKSGTLIPQVRLCVVDIERILTKAGKNKTTITTTSRDDHDDGGSGQHSGVVAVVEPPTGVPRDAGLVLLKFGWQPLPRGGNLVVVWANREQNTSWYTVCSEHDEDNQHHPQQKQLGYNCEILLVQAPKAGWVLPTKGIVFDKVGEWFLDIFPRDEEGGASSSSSSSVAAGGGSPYGIFQVHTLTGRLKAVGSAAVIPDQFGILHWLHDPDWVLYAGVPAGNTTQSHIYKVGTISTGGGADGSSNNNNEESAEEHHCLTCLLKNSAGAQCLFNLAAFSPGGKYFALSCEAPFQPPQVAIYETRALRKVVVLSEHEEIRAKLAGIHLPIIKDLGPFPIGDGGPGSGTGTARLFLPPSFGGVSDAGSLFNNNNNNINRESTSRESNNNNNGNKKVPLILHVHAAPDHKLITDAYLFNTQAEGLAVALAATHGLAVLFVDATGSAYQPVHRIFQVKHSLSKDAVDDQLSVAGTIAALPFIDESRVAVWGWSYGGFMAGATLAKDEKGLIKCGALVAPVVNWLYYSALYAERYMGQPQDFPQAYADCDLAAKPWLFRNKSLLLVHGSADVNVHLDNSMALAQSLQADGQLFRQQLYPDEPHDFPRARAHLFKTMLDFWLNDCFGLDIGLDDLPVT